MRVDGVAGQTDRIWLWREWGLHVDYNLQIIYVSLRVNGQFSNRNENSTEKKPLSSEIYASHEFAIWKAFKSKNLQH